MPTELRIGGLTRLSSCDWPGELVATIFCQGCSWCCPYCHNPDLRPATAPSAVAWPDVQAFLKTRTGLLDGVVFTGGEPLLQGSLPDAMRQVRDLGFRVGLHTGGAVPERFAGVLPLTDWIGFDVKAPFDDYASITGSPNSGVAAGESLKSLLASGKVYEIRTTIHPLLLDGGTLFRIAEDLAGLGITHWVLQDFRPHPQIALSVEPYEESVFSGLQSCSLQIVRR